MNLPEILNVAIGLVLLYFLLSTLASAIVEALVVAGQFREEILYVTINGLLSSELGQQRPWNIRRLLRDRASRWSPAFGIKPLWWLKPKDLPGDYPELGSVAADFWAHAKVRSLTLPGRDAPGSLEATTFAAVLIDVAIERDSVGELPTSRVALERRLQPIPGSPLSAHLRESLLTLGLSSEIPLGASGEGLWAPFRANVARWYEEAMATATARYRRHLTKCLLICGVVIAGVLNADSLRVAFILAQDKDLAAAVAAYADTVVRTRESEQAATDPAQVELAKVRTVLSERIEEIRTLESIGFPVGWTLEWKRDFVLVGGASQSVVLTLFLKIVGLLLTAIAISQGAQYWYELLRKLLSARKGDAPASSPDGTPGSRRTTVITGDVLTPAAAAATKEVVPLEIGRDLARHSGGVDFRKAYWLARASKAAYFESGEVFSITRSEWRFADVKILSKSTTVQIGKSQVPVDTQAFIAADDRVIIASFRGTELHKLNDIITDLRLRWTDPAEIIPARRVHLGFYAALEAVFDAVQSEIVRCAQLPTVADREQGASEAPTRHLFLTGHSLGGALATLCLARLRDPRPGSGPYYGGPVSLYTYGCPLVGDEEFANGVEAAAPQNVFRFVHGDDIVPSVPPEIAGQNGYCHAGEMLYFANDGTLKRNVSSLNRWLGQLSNGVQDFRKAAQKAVNDHDMSNYIARCHEVALTSPMS